MSVETAAVTAEELSEAVDPVTCARDLIADKALRAGGVGRVGLELELHLVDLTHPERRPDWDTVLDLVAGLPPMPSGSTVTLEPGAQVELSGPPFDDVHAAIAGLRRDVGALRSALGERGFGAAGLGTDPARPIQRVNPAERYRAMETHFDALGCAGAGRSMMAGTAALQVNLDAGPAEGWSERMDLVRSLVPVLLAVSSTSPYLAGSTDGWHSMRQGVWQGIDHARSEPYGSGEPLRTWARYALGAPVMLLREDEQLRPVTSRVTFEDWLRDPDTFGRRATTADLEYHLTTLFPPVRPRGYIEIRPLDSAPDRWWPALAALTATLVDDPEAAAVARAACRDVGEEWERAARLGLADERVRRAAHACLDVAARRTTGAVGDDLAELAAMASQGRSIADQVRADIERDGPLATLAAYAQEEATDA